MSHQAIPTKLLPMQQAPFNQVPTTQSATLTTSHEASNDLVRALAEAITAN